MTHICPITGESYSVTVHKPPALTASIVKVLNWLDARHRRRVAASGVGMDKDGVGLADHGRCAILTPEPVTAPHNGPAPSGVLSPDGAGFVGGADAGPWRLGAA